MKPSNSKKVLQEIQIKLGRIFADTQTMGENHCTNVLADINLRNEMKLLILQEKSGVGNKISPNKPVKRFDKPW